MTCPKRQLITSVGPLEAPGRSRCVNTPSVPLRKAMSETAAGFAVSWWMVRAAVNEPCLLKLPDVDGSEPSDARH